MSPEDVKSRLLYCDPEMLVFDKPSGLAVHPGPGEGDNLSRYLPLLQMDAPDLPQLAHRLDRATSGCLVLGRNRGALARLGKLFSQGRVEKTYWAVVLGGPEAQEGRISLGLRKEHPRTWKMVADDVQGQPAVTDWRVLGRGFGMTWLELKPRTGRTHQLRVHCQASGWPILGDFLYGGKAGNEPLHLHARALSLPKVDRTLLEVEAPIPTHMADALTASGYR